IQGVDSVLRLRCRQSAGKDVIVRGCHAYANEDEGDTSDSSDEEEVDREAQFDADDEFHGTLILSNLTLLDGGEGTLTVSFNINPLDNPEETFYLLVESIVTKSERSGGYSRFYLEHSRREKRSA
ncbi:hypothetical protein PMAYCL1PPCAC_06620, partial [Pristionchus mayeri]